MVGRCCDAVPRLIIKSCRERSCSNTSTHRHTLSLTTRTHTRQGQLPQIRLLPAAVEFPPLSPLCALLSSRTMEWKPLPPQQPPAAPSSPKSWNLGHPADMSAARGLLAAGSIRKQSTQRSPFSWGSPPATTATTTTPHPQVHVHVRHVRVCALCGQVQEVVEPPGAKTLHRTRTPSDRSGSPSQSRSQIRGAALGALRSTSPCLCFRL